MSETPAEPVEDGPLPEPPAPVLGEPPRKSVETDPARRRSAELSDIWKHIEALERGAPLRNASISGGRGLRVIDEVSGVTRLEILPNGTIVGLDTAGNPVVRFGTMIETGDDPDSDPFGIEVNVDGVWIQLGTQSVAWGNVGGKPATFTPSNHQHFGYDVVTAVANATNASEADHAALADGSQYGFNNSVSGTQFYALWVGNDGGFHIGRNTSSERWKENIRPWDGDPKAILNVEPVYFNRKPRLIPPALGIGPENLVAQQAVNEFGAIAEQAHVHAPEATQWFDGEIDGIYYEKYGLLLIPVVREHEERLAVAERTIEEQGQQIEELRAAVRALGGNI